MSTVPSRIARARWITSLRCMPNWLKMSWLKWAKQLKNGSCEREEKEFNINQRFTLNMNILRIIVFSHMILMW